MVAPAAIAALLKNPKVVKGLIAALGNVENIDGGKLKEGVDKIMSVKTLSTPFEIAIAQINAQIDEQTADQMGDTLAELMKLLSSNSVQDSIKLFAKLINEVLKAFEYMSEIISSVDTPEEQALFDLIRHFSIL